MSLSGQSIALVLTTKQQQKGNTQNTNNKPYHKETGLSKT